MHRITLCAWPLALVFLLGYAPGCPPSAPPAETLTVEGRVAVVGPAPFSAYLLETDAHNTYVLEWSEEVRQGLATPARIRATGTVYRGEWRGVPQAYLRVATWERLED